VPNLFFTKSRLLINKTSADRPTECRTFADVLSASRVIDTDPSPLQIINENYRKAHIRIDGLPIVIETPQGMARKKRGPDGELISVREMPYPYGYINNTMSGDFAPIDVFIGDNPGTKIVYVLDMLHQSGDFDEHKVFIWFRDKKHAKNCFYDSFETKKKAKRKVMDIVGIHLFDFKQWLKTNGTLTPISQQEGWDFI
jgi:hypothetical protein